MCESDTMFKERDWRCATVQLMFATNPGYDNRTIASTLKMQIQTAQRIGQPFGGGGAEAQGWGHHQEDPDQGVHRKGPSNHWWNSPAVWWSPGAIRWLVADPGCGSRTRHRPTSPKRPSTLKMQILIATNNRDVPRVMKTKFPAAVMVFSVVSSEGHIMPPHIFEVGLKVNTKVYLDVLKSVVIPWCNQVADPGCGSRTRCQPTSPKRPRLGFRRSAMTLYPSLTGPPLPSTWTRWTTSFSHMSRTSPTWSPATPKPAWSPPSAKYSPSSHQHLWKRHAPSSVSRRWLRLTAATLNRCQLYYIIKLSELIFSIKVLK